MRRMFPVVVTMLLLTPSAQGMAAAPADRGLEKIDARVALELKGRVPRLVTEPSRGKLVAARRASAEVPVVIALTGRATGDRLDALSNVGARLREVGGEILRHGRFVPADLDEESAARVSELGFVERIHPAPQSGPVPMDHSAELLGLDDAWGSRPAHDLLSGEGILIADIDTNADIFHPKFFYGDGGYFDWIDVDGDGRLTVGVDAVDLDGDGTAVGEIAEAVISQTVSYYGTEVDARESGFDPSVDWIYIDENGNGERDFGAWNGFDDSIPAFGEPIFVPDDVNLNGVIDVGERLVRLGTSKFAKVFHYFNYDGYDPVDRVYERGVDLSAMDTDFMDEGDSSAAAGHASGVCGILVGDVPLVGRRWVGIAPGAEMLLAADRNEEGNGLIWVLEEGADVVLHERANWFGSPLDGTDVTSVMVDESTLEDGVTHSCPVGNTGGARKHAHLELVSGGSAELGFEIPELEDNYYVSISMNIQGDGDEALTIVPPVGDSFSLGALYQAGDLDGGGKYYAYRGSTPKGTRFYEVLLYLETMAGELPLGDWAVQVSEEGEGDLVFDGYLMDVVSSWGLGVAWDETFASDDRTIGWPATSDTCIAVGAHTGHPATLEEPWYYHEEGAGEIREYSGRGPTIDGRQKPDVAAPDNPWAPSAYGQTAYAFVPHGAVAVFGGTSGAGPHVTGVTALLAQVGIVGEEARQIIRDAAEADELTGDAPNYDYGWGRLSAAGALGVTGESTVPTVSLTVPEASVGEAFTIGVAADSGESLEIKWDMDYDGTWDTDYAAVADLETAYDEPGDYVLKARVRNSRGRVAEAVALVTVTQAEVPNSGSSACGCYLAGRGPKPSLFGSILSLL